MVDKRTIEEILSTLPDKQKENVQNLRILISKIVPESVELVKAGKITYKLNGKDFVWICHYQTHLDLEFANGSHLDSNALKSRGVAKQNQNVRHIPVGNFDKLTPDLCSLLKQAAELEL